MSFPKLRLSSLPCLCRPGASLLQLHELGSPAPLVVASHDLRHLQLRAVVRRNFRSSGALSTASINARVLLCLYILRALCVSSVIFGAFRFATRIVPRAPSLWSFVMKTAPMSRRLLPRMQPVRHVGGGGLGLKLVWHISPLDHTGVQVLL